MGDTLWNLYILVTMAEVRSRASKAGRHPLSAITKNTFYWNTVTRCFFVLQGYQHTLACMWWELAWGGMKILVKSPARGIKHCHRYLKALHPISLPTFVPWLIPASLFSIFNLFSKYFSILSRVWSLELGAWKVRKGTENVATTYRWKF